MKLGLLSLCAGCLLVALPCRAQQSPPAASASSAPILNVYVARIGMNMLPRIALGIEKPALQITAFARCAPITTANPSIPAGLAVQLKPEDAKSLLEAVKKAAITEGGVSVGTALWIMTPDNTALDYILFDTKAAADNLEGAGVLAFVAEQQDTTAKYLATKLHLQ